MKLVDDKGKLFGLINIIDLIVLVFVVALVLGGAYRIYGPRQNGDIFQQEGDAVQLKGRVFDVSQYTVDVIQKGDILIDTAAQLPFGEIISVETVPHRRLVDTAEGKVMLSEVPERFDVILSIKGMAQVSEYAIRIASHDVRVGSRIVLGARDYMIATTILRVEVLE
ncbi:MAG: hypothetical protein DDT19_00190 [Syntrophomonadaceae bacterium]|nr:hypothetical protein [Bacillota bacterium]